MTEQCMQGSAGLRFLNYFFIVHQQTIEFIVVESRGRSGHDSETAAKQHEAEDHAQADDRQRKPSLDAEAVQCSNGNHQHQ